MPNSYYQKRKERLRKKACERYQNLSEEKKIKGKKAQERYQNLTEEEKKESRNKNLSEEKKMKLAEYRRNYYLTPKK